MRKSKCFLLKVYKSQWIKKYQFFLRKINTFYQTAKSKNIILYITTFSLISSSNHVT